MPPNQHNYDAIVIGAGPNGLAAAIEIARAGRSVCLYERNSTIGGGTRSAELTRPGFIHDVCSAVHPLGASSPFFSQLPLQKHGLEFIYPPAELAHPFDDGTALLLERSLDSTAQRLGKDRNSYKKTFTPLVAAWHGIKDDLLGPISLMPRHPFAMARFGLSAIRSAKSFAEARFQEDKTRALFAGLAGHSFLSLDQAGTTAFGLVLGILAHVVGWPIPRGGSQNLANALGSHLVELGGEIVTDHRVESLKDLPQAQAILCDVTPRQLLHMTSDLTPAYRKRLERYRYGPAAFKLDWALNAPVPWKAAECRLAATVHLGGSFAEILESEWKASHGHHSEKPLVLVAQPSLFDPTRAPNGQHTLWAYCHVPNGSTVDMRETIERQIERFAPGFRDCIIARNVMTPADYERYNPNLIGGDINGGIQDLAQMFLRPTARMYSTSLKNLYLCSSSTPPGGGVHGMCGYHAARVALRKSLR